MTVSETVSELERLRRDAEIFEYSRQWWRRSMAYAEQANAELRKENEILRARLALPVPWWQEQNVRLGVVNPSGSLLTRLRT